MGFSIKVLILAAPLLSAFLSTIVTASPLLSTGDTPVPPIITPPPAPAPPPPPELACTRTDQVIGGGRNPKISVICNCNDGSHPSATVKGDQYVCPAQVSSVAKVKRSEYNGIELGGFR